MYIHVICMDSECQSMAQHEIGSRKQQQSLPTCLILTYVLWYTYLHTMFYSIHLYIQMHTEHAMHHEKSIYMSMYMTKAVMSHTCQQSLVSALSSLIALISGEYACLVWHTNRFYKLYTYMLNHDARGSVIYK